MRAPVSRGKKFTITTAKSRKPYSREIVIGIDQARFRDKDARLVHWEYEEGIDIDKS